MNKINAAILLLSGCVFTTLAEDLKPLPQNPTFTDVRNASFTPEKIKKIRSGRFIFYIEGTKYREGYLMLRAKQYDQVRVDAWLQNEHFCAVRNGEDFWMYNKKDGKIAMSNEEKEDFIQYIAFLPFPVSKKQVFSKPVFIKEETVRKSKRLVFESRGTDVVCQMSIDKKTRRLRKVKETDKDDKVGFIKLYSDYKPVAGIDLPHTINISRVNANIEMTLLTADINLELDPSIFDKKAPIVDRDLAFLRASRKAFNDQKVQKQTTVRNKALEEQLERKIMKLKAEIQDCERRMAKIEQVSMTDRNQAAAISASGSGNNHYWDGSWGYRSSSNRSQRRMQKAVKREIKELNENYTALSDKLMRRRAELSEAEYDLKKLRGQ